MGKEEGTTEKQRRNRSILKNRKYIREKKGKQNPREMLKTKSKKEKRKQGSTHR